MSRNRKLIVAEVEQWHDDEIDAQFNTLNPKKLTFKKLVTVIENCLAIVGCTDASKFMIKHSLPVTEENVAQFERMSDEFYKIRMQILKDLVLKEYHKSFLF